MENLQHIETLEEIDNTILFATYAGDNHEKWERIVGWTIAHKQFGTGFVVDAKPSGKDIIFSVSFHDLPQNESTKRFLHKSLFQGFFTLSSIPLSDEEQEFLRGQIQEQIRAEREAKRAQDEHQKGIEAERNHREEQRKRQHEREAKAREQFAALRTKYGIGNISDTSPSSLLFVILIKIDECKVLNLKDIEWLKRHGAYQVLAYYYGSQYSETGDLWNLVKAGSFWRKARQPEKAIELTKNLGCSDERLQAALLTNRGAALRDLLLLDEAKSCAIEAIQSDPSSYYPHNLLGAIYYQQGMAEEGYQHFEKALVLGASEKMQDETIRSSIEQANPVERQNVAIYLLSKDPKKYDWAKYYLSGS